MPTVIDSLIVTLGLDPKSYISGVNAATAAQKKLKDDAVKNTSDVEVAAKKTGEYLGSLQSKVLKIASLAIGGSGLAAFIKQSVTADAQVGRLSYTLGTNAETLNKWRGAVTLVGGSADDVTKTISGLVGQFQNFSITGESSVIPYFRALGVNIADSEGKMRPFEAIMRDLANAFQKLDPAKAAAFASAIGIDQNTLNLLIKGGDELDRLLKTSEKLNNLTPAQADNAAKLAKSWNELSLAASGLYHRIADSLAPELESLAQYYTNMMNNGTFVKKGSLGYKILSYMTQSEGNAQGAPASSTAPISASGGGSGAFTSQSEKEAFIRAEAAKRGISPEVAMAVARSEGFNTFQSSVVRRDGSREPSWGAFQLYTGGGLGNSFQKATGLDPSDKANERATISYALDQAKQGGWGPWHGWKGDKWAGIAPGAGSAAGNDNSSRSTSSSQTKVDTVNVYTQATDANGIAASIKPALENSSSSWQAESGGH